jgi:hypothetical protein
MAKLAGSDMYFLNKFLWIGMKLVHRGKPLSLSLPARVA